MPSHTVPLNQSKKIPQALHCSLHFQGLKYQNLEWSQQIHNSLNMTIAPKTFLSFPIDKYSIFSWSLCVATIFTFLGWYWINILGRFCRNSCTQDTFFCLLSIHVRKKSSQKTLLAPQPGSQHEPTKMASSPPVMDNNILKTDFKNTYPPPSLSVKQSGKQNLRSLKRTTSTHHSSLSRQRTLQ